MSETATDEVDLSEYQFIPFAVDEDAEQVAETHDGVAAHVPHAGVGPVTIAPKNAKHGFLTRSLDEYTEADKAALREAIAADE